MDHDGNPRMSRDEGGASANGPAALYRLNSNQSSSSVFEDVEMAHDEVPHRIDHPAYSSTQVQSPRACPAAYLHSLIVEPEPTQQRALHITKTLNN
jgi:hypothetical protein